MVFEILNKFSMPTALGAVIVTLKACTVIRFIFVAKIFLHIENIQKYFTRINFTMKFSRIGWLRLHISTSQIAAAHISLYMWPLTQQAISFSPPISSAHCAIPSINAHHKRFDFHSIGLSENYFTRIVFY